MARMGSGGSGAPGKPTKIVKRAASKPAAKVVRKTAAPVTDVQSSGGDYGTKKAKAYQRTPAARKPVIVATPVIVRDSQTGKTHTVVVKKPYTKLHSQDLIPGVNPKSILHVALRGWNNIYGGGGGDESKNPGAGGSAFIGPTLDGPQGKVAEAVKANAVEAYKHPGATAKGFVNQVTGTVGAVGGIGLPVLDAAGNLVQGHPGRALGDLGKAEKGAERLVGGMVKDYKYRYGPLAKGDYKGYEKRVHKVGAAAGLTDIALATTGGGKLLRPVTRGVIKAFPKGKAFLTDPRPDLRTTGGEAKPQALSHKPTRVALQRLEDKARVVGNEGGHIPVPLTKKRITIRKPGRGADKAGLKPALQPRVANDVAAGLGGKVRREVVPISDRLVAKAQRVQASRTSAKLNVRFKHEKAIEVARGADRAFGGLDRKLRPAEFHVLQGLIPIHEGATVADVVRELRAQRETLVANSSPKSIPVLRPHTELATIDHLVKHADQIFTPKGLAALRQFHAGELARGKRVTEGSRALRQATSDARVRRVQGERLGIPYAPADAGGKPLAGVERDTYNTNYAQAVKKAADAKGLPEPVYFKHVELPLTKRSSETAGNVAKAVARSKQSKMTLLKTNRAIVSHQAYRQGLLDTIKAKHQVGAVADVAREHAFAWSLGDRGVGMTPHELLREMYRRKLRPEDVTLLNPGILHKSADALDLAETAHPKDAAAALQGSMLDGHTAAALAKSDTLVRTSGWIAVPKAAGEEVLAATRPAGRTNRVLGRLQGLQSAAILGLNVSWEPMQVAANFLQSFAGMHGNVADMLRNNIDYQRLDPAHQEMAREALNASASEGMTSQSHLGYHQGAIARTFERVGQVPIVRYKGRGIKVTDLNPVRITFGIDSLNNDFFRRSVFFNELKRQQARDLVTSVGHAQAALRRVSSMLKGNHLEQLRNVLEDPRAVEEAARYTDRVLGDYLNYTARERKYAKVGIMFYGFMRYATKTLFYTLPVHHPLAGAIALKLGQLHDEEIYKIFGTRDLPPWVFSRSYEYDSQGKPVLDKHGNPKYRDLARINPVTGPVTDVVTTGYKSVAGLVSPLFQGAADLVAGETVQTGQSLRLHGSAEKPKAIGLMDGVRVLLNREASSTFPGRVIMSADGKTLGDDSLPFSARPVVYKTAKARARDAQRIAARPTLGQQLFPLFEPRTDTTKTYLATHGHGPTAKIDKQIKAGEDQLKKLAPGGKVPLDQYGYPVKAYADAADHVRVLKQQRAKILKTPKRAVLKRRPLTTRQALLKSIADERKTNVRQQILDEIAREREQAKVNGGG